MRGVERSSYQYAFTTCTEIVYPPDVAAALPPATAKKMLYSFFVGLWNSIDSAAPGFGPWCGAWLD